MAFGSDGLGIQFNSASDAQFIGMMALSIILFSGGMDTRYADIKPVLKQGILLSTVGVLVTTLLTGLFIFFLSHYTHANIELTLMVSLLLAATMSSTDSASVFSLLRSQRMNLKYNLRPMLELESGSNDPMAYMLTIVLIQVIGSGSNFDVTVILKDLFIQFLFGGVIMQSFSDGEIGEIYLAYTHFKNTVSHEPKLIKLLPVEIEAGDVAEDTDSNILMNYEPTTEEALDMIIPKYVTSLFYGALVEAVASENGARMQAMDSATSNAEEMISDLTLKYNRARQGAITQELTEIIAGASAIS